MNNNTINTVRQCISQKRVEEITILKNKLKISKKEITLLKNKLKVSEMDKKYYMNKAKITQFG